MQSYWQHIWLELHSKLTNNAHDRYTLDSIHRTGNGKTTAIHVSLETLSVTNGLKTVINQTLSRFELICTVRTCATVNKTGVTKEFLNLLYGEILLTLDYNLPEITVTSPEPIKYRNIW